MTNRTPAILDRLPPHQFPNGSPENHFQYGPVSLVHVPSHSLRVPIFGSMTSGAWFRHEIHPRTYLNRRE